ncbi:hypothetical protein CLAFUR4_03907 [Fulvia fulva]|nr:hypothetical protein CLAFUR4_03907 [Fulvia fulva]WPV26449.1 hypothetical protein CLAFUW7_03910 [Fulvia fulva]
MSSFRLTTATLTALLLPALINASGLGLSDSGTAASCTGSQGCCIPSCLVDVSDFYGCNGNVAFSGTCQQNYDNPRNTQDVGGCSDVQVTFLKDPSGNPVIDLYYNPNKTYDLYSFSNCRQPTEGGSRCAPRGGGCDTKQILTGAQG